jgi:DNA-directed RNA polymerase III subunit RPC4
MSSYDVASLLKSETASPTPEADDFRLDMSSNQPLPAEIADYFPVRLETRDAEDDEAECNDDALITVEGEVKVEPLDESSPPLPTKNKDKRGGHRLEHTGLHEEERRERRRVDHDHQQIIKEFNMLSVTDEGQKPEIENKLYFFQLPGVIPEFELPEDDNQRVNQPVTIDDDDIMALDGDAEVKAEAGTTEDVVTPNSSPEGQIGQLRLHKSGRLTMVLGDVEMEVTQGTECSFLQEVVVLDRANKRACLIGQVANRMVLSPDISQF